MQRRKLRCCRVVRGIRGEIATTELAIPLMPPTTRRLTWSLRAVLTLGDFRGADR